MDTGLDRSRNTSLQDGLNALRVHYGKLHWKRSRFGNKPVEEGCSLVVNPLWSGASTERRKTSRWMPRVAPPMRPPGAPRLGGVYTGTGAGASGFLLWSFRF